MADTPNGVAGDVSRDDTSSSRVVVSDGFFSPGVMVPPVLGPADRGTYVQAFYSGKDSFSLILGDSFRSQFEMWTSFEGFEALVAALQSHLEKAREARP